MMGSRRLTKAVVEHVVTQVHVILACDHYVRTPTVFRLFVEAEYSTHGPPLLFTTLHSTPARLYQLNQKRARDLSGE